MPSFKFVRQMSVVLFLLVALDLLFQITPHSGAFSGVSALGGLFARNVTITAALGLLIAFTRWRGLRLALALAAAPLAIDLVNVVEGAVFLPSANLQPWRIALAAMVKFSALAILVLRLFPVSVPPEAPSVERTISPLGLISRFLAADLLYLVLYFLAGMIIYPFVREFYATQSVPPIGRLAALELLGRGPLFVAICILISRLITAQRVRRAFAVGLVFSLLSGVAPLISPNPFFPDAVRWIHLAEVSGSNFLFGLGVTLLFARKSAAMPAALPRPVAG